MTQAPPGPSSDTPVLRLGTRRSPLAMAQAEEARRRLCTAHGWEADRVELVPVVASGDKVQDRPLAEIGGKALWTRELDLWLAEGRIHASVHSLKDVETMRPDAFTFGAFLPRADRRDRLIGPASLADLPPGATIGTSAPRRAAQAMKARPDCRVVMFRGNVATRLAKLEAGEADATFLAAAGLDRLDLEETGTPLDPEHWLPAPSQGAIALECRVGDDHTMGLLAAVDHAPTRAEVLAERAFLAGLQGTCHSPIALWCRRDGAVMRMDAAIYSEDGHDGVSGAKRFEEGDLDAVAVFAGALLAEAPDTIRRLFGTTA